MIVKVTQLHFVTDGAQFITPEDGIAIVRWVTQSGGEANLAWDAVDHGTFVNLRLIVGCTDAELTRAEPGDWIVRDPFGHFRAVDGAVFDITHEVVDEVPS